MKYRFKEIHFSLKELNYTFINLYLECVYESGDAFGAEKQNVGAVTNQEECVEKCAELKIKDMSINAAVVDAKTGKQCSCVKKATARRRNPDLNSCFFKMDGEKF